MESEPDDNKKIYKLTKRYELQERSEVVARIGRRAGSCEDGRGDFDPETAEIRGPAERPVKAGFRAVGGEFATITYSSGSVKSCCERCAN